MKFDENYQFYEIESGFYSDIYMKSWECYKLLFLQIKTLKY